MGKLSWEALPASRVAAIESLVGPVVKAEAITTGLMPGLAAVLHTEGGRYFVKAAPRDSPAYALYARELAVNAALPLITPAPRMLAGSDTEGWLVMLFTCLDGRNADLSPGSPDLSGVLAALETIGSLPARDTAPPVAVNIEALRDKAAVLLSGQPRSGQPRKYPWDMYADAIESFDSGYLAGNNLVHYDLHPGNLTVTSDGQVLAIDWAFACAGAPWIDAALLVPRLIEAGHSPAAAERLMSRLPAWHAAPAPAVTALGALWSMFREYKALHGPHDSREFRARAARAGRSWITHRMSQPGKPREPGPMPSQLP
jgi:aminoglycoside phosphotransferase (APT) family kinase protein